MTPRITALLVTGALTVAGCSADDDSSANTTTEPVATAAAPSTTEAATSDAPTTTVAGPSTEFAEWCVLAADVDELGDQSDSVDYTDPVAVEAYLDELVPALESAADQAPDEIADAAATSADIAGRLRNALADADYDMLVADLSLIDELDAERDAAQQSIRTFNAEHCGIEFDDEVDTDEDDFSFSDGSLRDQFIGQLVSGGFTLREAACIFDEMDFASADSMDDPDALLPIFEACDIDAGRLEEIGAAAPPVALDGEVLGTSLAALGLDDEQIDCVVDEIESTPPAAVDEAFVTTTMLGCGVTIEQLTDPDISSSGELEELMIEQFMAMGIDEAGARCLYDELLVGNIGGFTAEDVMNASIECGIDAGALG